MQYNEVPKRLIPQDDKECAALPRRLKLAVGARVMLRRNINCGDGLVNGTRGQIVGSKWPGNASDQSKPGELPVEVYVRFLDPNVGRISMVPRRYNMSDSRASTRISWSKCYVNN